MRIFIIFLLSLCIGHSAFAEEKLFFPKETIFISNKQLSVEVATTPAQLQHGMMFRKSWGKTDGMLFIFKKPQKVSMWMKNTYLPLDMLFLDSKGNIIHRVENTKPESLMLIHSPAPAKALLELPAGSVKKWKITQKDAVVYDEFTR